MRFTNAGLYEWYLVPGYKSEDDLLKLADAAVGAGCDDPLVTYRRAVLLDDHLKRSPAETGPIVQAPHQPSSQAYGRP